MHLVGKRAKIFHGFINRWYHCQDGSVVFFHLPDRLMLDWYPLILHIPYQRLFNDEIEQIQKFYHQTFLRYHAKLFFYGKPKWDAENESNIVTLEYFPWLYPFGSQYKSSTEVQPKVFIKSANCQTIIQQCVPKIKTAYLAKFPALSLNGKIIEI